MLFRIKPNSQEIRKRNITCERKLFTAVDPVNKSNRVHYLWKRTTKITKILIISQLWCFWRLQARVLMFNRLACFWPKGYQRESLGKSHQNGDYLKQAMQKSCLPTGFEPADELAEFEPANVKNIIIDFLLKSYNKQVVGLKQPKLSMRGDVFSSSSGRAVDR